MSLKLKAVALGEGCHLRHGNHVRAGAAQDNDVSVIDHLSFAAAFEILRGLGQEYFAVEALEGRVELEKQHVRVTQNFRGSLHEAQPPRHFDLMRRSVGLGFLPGLEVQ